MPLQYLECRTYVRTHYPSMAICNSIIVNNTVISIYHQTGQSEMKKLAATPLFLSPLQSVGVFGIVP